MKPGRLAAFPSRHTRKRSRRQPSSGASTRCLGCTAWFEKSRGGERQVVFVTGEAGIGKTTLLDTFARHISTDHRRADL